VTGLPDLAPRSVTKAAQLVAAREADLAAAKASVDEAKRKLVEAGNADRALLADSLDRGEGDPGTPNTTAANEAVGEAQRVEEAQALRLARAREQLAEVTTDALPAWEAALTKATIESETAALDLVAQLGEAVAERARLRQALAWTRNRADGGVKAPVLHALPTPSTLVINAAANPHEKHSIEALLGYVREGLERASLSAEPERASQAVLHVA
jgi:hypothetical protein